MSYDYICSECGTDPKTAEKLGKYPGLERCPTCGTPMTLERELDFLERRMKCKAIAIPLRNESLRIVYGHPINFNKPGALFDIGNTNIFVYRFSLCQFTGKKDSNGKNIYEKDLVKLKFYNLEYEAIVLFGDHETYDEDSFQQYNAYGWYYEYKIGENICTRSMSCSDIKACEVIGNVVIDPYIESSKQSGEKKERKNDFNDYIKDFYYSE